MAKSKSIIRKIVVSKSRRAVAVATTSSVRVPIWKVQGTNRASNQLRMKMEERQKAKAERAKSGTLRIQAKITKFPAPSPLADVSLHLYTNSSTGSLHMPPVKLYKLVDDPCFGQKHEMIEPCKTCWIKKSCATKFRNRHHA